MAVVALVVHPTELACNGRGAAIGDGASTLHEWMVALCKTRGISGRMRTVAMRALPGRVFESEYELGALRSCALACALREYVEVAHSLPVN